MLKSKDPDPIFVLRSANVSITSLAYCYLHQEDEEEEEVLITGDLNGLIQIWNLKSKRVRLKIQAGNQHGILKVGLIMLDGEQYIFCHDRGGTVNFFQLSDPDVAICKHHIKVHDIGFCPVDILSLAEDGAAWLAYPYATDSQFCVSKILIDEIADVYKMKAVEKLGMVMRLKLFSKNHTLFVVAGYENGSIYIWNVLDTSVVSQIKVYQDPVMSMSIDKKCEKIITTSSTNVICVYKLTEAGILENFTKEESKSSGFSACVIRDDSKIVVCGGWDGKIRVYGWRKLKPLAILKYHEATINDICFSEGDLLAAASKDGKVSIWDVYKNTT